jgi:hypothetical protein
MRQLDDAFNGRSCTVETFLLLHARRGERMRAYHDSRPPEAEAFRRRNLKAIEAAEKIANDPYAVYQQFIPGMLNLFQTPHWRQTRPGVEYHAEFTDSSHTRLRNVDRYVTAPLLPAQNRKFLLTLTPPELRALARRPIVPVDDTLGFAYHIKDAGDEFVHALAQILRQMKRQRADLADQEAWMEMIHSVNAR